MIDSENSSRKSPLDCSDVHDPILEIRDLKTHFFLRSGTAKAVDGVHLTVHRRRTLGLVGESGSGKSVTSLSILRLIRPPTGRIVAGEILYRRPGQGTVDLLSLDAECKQMRQIRGNEIAMVFQEPMTSLNPLYTVGRQLAESIKVHERIGKHELNERVVSMLKKVGISDPARRAREYPHHLSGGMRQRVMIAMALSCHPQVLIADEPTTALDVTVQAQIMDLLSALQADLGMGIIFITHNLGLIAQAADDVAVMYFGKVVEQADVKTLFENPLHPYTNGLLKSVPVFGRKRKDLTPIAGRVPDSTEEITGCPYAPRCPRRMPICNRECPNLESVETKHSVACWLHCRKAKAAG